MKYYTMKETRAFLESIGMPGGDLYDLPTSEKRFSAARRSAFSASYSAESLLGAFS